jgi:hypothetical protein
MKENQDPTEAKITMISLKAQLENQHSRLMRKIVGRRIKAGVKQPVGMVNTGNRDHGIPYKGKDKYSGQFRQFADRILMFDSKDKFGRDIHRLHYADNNKYNGNGTLRD